MNKISNKEEEYTKFVMRLLRLMAANDCTGDLFWSRNQEGTVDFAINCNDLFYWAFGDAENVTLNNIDILEKAFEDVSKVTSGWAYEGIPLFCSRMRKMRPQGAYYEYLDENTWSLFDACGPEREVGFGNPHHHPLKKREIEKQNENSSNH